MSTIQPKVDEPVSEEMQLVHAAQGGDVGSFEELVKRYDRNVFRIEAPPGTKIFNGDRALDVDFDIVSLNGEMFLAKDVLEMARTGARGFRLAGFEPLPDE